MKDTREHTCCFFGHRKITETEKLKKRMYAEIQRLIKEENVYIFLFGSRSDFDDLCHSIVTDLKEKHPHIQRIYVRAEFPYIRESYKKLLLTDYEDTYFPQNVINAGRASYVKRNYEMIEKSRFCICYYDKEYTPPVAENSRRPPKSGTEIAFAHAIKRKLSVTNVFEG